MPSNIVFNVPNTLSAVRIVLAIVFFVLVPWRTTSADIAAIAVFLVAVITDAVDGWWARRFQQITKLGRVLDPFADKILICGAFILLAVEQREAKQSFGIAGWMAVVIVGRELLVTALRGAIETGGGDFSAKWSGKWKMVLQCAAVVAALMCLVETDAGRSIAPWLRYSTAAMAWGAVAITLYSGVEYVLAAIRMMSKAIHKESDHG